MKKLLLLFILLSFYAVSDAQKLPDTVSKDNSRVGIATEARDTLYVLDCSMGRMLVDGWNSVTKDELKSYGIEKPPVFVMIDNPDKFSGIVRRIKREKSL